MGSWHNKQNKLLRNSIENNSLFLPTICYIVISGSFMEPHESSQEICNLEHSSLGNSAIKLN